MSENKDELLIRKFFKENKADIPDNGFTCRVMKRLPDRTQRLNRIWTAICIALGVVVATRFDWWNALSSQVKNITETVMTNHVIEDNPFLLFIGLLILIFLCGYNLISSER